MGPPGLLLRNTYISRVYLNSATNTTNVGWQKIPIDTISFDIGSIWDTTNKRFIPKAAGYYHIDGRIRTNTTGSSVAGLGFNGTQSQGLGGDGALTTNGFAYGGGTIVFCNGSTDYLELFFFANTVRALTTGSFDTYMTVHGPL